MRETFIGAYARSPLKEARCSREREKERSGMESVRTRKLVKYEGTKEREIYRYALFHGVGKGDDGGSDGFLYARRDTRASTSFPPHGKFSLFLFFSRVSRVSSLVSLFLFFLGHVLTREENNALYKVRLAGHSQSVANSFDAR